VRAEVAPRHTAAAEYQSWKEARKKLALFGLCSVVVGVVFFSLNPDPDNPESRVMYPILGYFGVIVGSFLLACSLYFSLAGRRAKEHHDRIAWGEDEEPPA
jgi:drug/metabolite transporter (DMT)-like permease